jgi:hypothetical protein
METNTPLSAAQTSALAGSMPAPSSTASETTGNSAAPHAADSHAESNSSHAESSPPGLNDFDSLEDYAQALLERRQNAANADDHRDGDAGGDAESENQATAEGDDHEESAQQAAADGESEDDANAEDESAQLDLAEDNVFSPRELNDRINANPVLKQALEADPELRNSMFRNARLAHDANSYRELFPDVESAKYAMENAASFRQIDEMFLNSTTPQGATQFLQHWAGMSMLRDEQGNPVVQNGVPQLHPAFHGFLEHINSRQMDFIRQQAERTGDQELMDALDVVRERTSASSQPQDHELPPYLRAAAQNLQRREQELNRQQLAQHKAAEAAFDLSVGKEAQSKIDSLINPVLEKAALSDFVRQTAREKIDTAILESLNKNRFFQARMAELARYPRSAESRQQRINLIMSHVQSLAGPVVRQVLKEASAPVMARQQERQQKIESQVARSRSEPRSTAGPALAGRQRSPEQLFDQIRSQYVNEHGEEPSAQKLIELWALDRRNGR